MNSAPSGWEQAIATHPLRTLDLTDLGRVVVVAAHPDDETLGVGGLLRSVHAAGGQVELIVATDGEAAFPTLGAAGRTALAQLRHDELDSALEALELHDVSPRWLGLPDSAVDDAKLAALLRPLLAHADTVLAPWEHDPHPDHAAAGRAARAAAPSHAHVFGYPIWLWAWETPQDHPVPWEHAYAHPLDEDTRAAKRRAVRRFASQLRPGPGGEAPILPPAVLEVLDTPREVLFRMPPTTSAPVTRFSALYDDGAPWEEDSWYERRKRSVLLACLPQSRYRHAAEPACGTGLLTRDLAERCDKLDSSDPVPLAVARALVTPRPGVTVREAALPTAEAVPPGVDLVVLSEVLYYLADDELTASIDRVADAVVPGGDVVVAHWRGWPAEAPRDAAATHARLTGDERFTTLVEHVDEQFLLHVLRRR